VSDPSLEYDGADQIEEDDLQPTTSQGKRLSKSGKSRSHTNAGDKGGRHEKAEGTYGVGCREHVCVDVMARLVRLTPLAGCALGEASRTTPSIFLSSLGDDSGRKPLESSEGGLKSVLLDETMSLQSQGGCLK
jgi:hypothetical protein